MWFWSKCLKPTYIDQATYDKVVAEAIVVRFSSSRTRKQGYSAYYKHYSEKRNSINTLEEYEKETGKDVNLYRDGLKNLM